MSLSGSPYLIQEEKERERNEEREHREEKGEAKGESDKERKRGIAESETSSVLQSLIRALS